MEVGRGREAWEEEETRSTESRKYSPHLWRQGREGGEAINMQVINRAEDVLFYLQ